MKETTETIYTCDYCGVYRKRKWAMELHEKRCWKNPDVRPACMNCIYLERKDAVYYREGYMGEVEMPTISWYCKRLKIDQFSHMVHEKESNDLLCSLLDQGFREMPKECKVKNEPENLKFT